MMPRRTRPAALVLAAALLLALTGCAGFTMVPPGPTAAKGMQLTPGTAWNRFNNPRHPSHLEVWTQHGPILDMLVVLGGLEDGRALLNLEGDDGGTPLPPFRSTMTATDIQSLFETTVARARRARTVDVFGLRPAPFVGQEGFRFEFAYLGADEVDRRGIAVGAVRQGRLYMIAFEGTGLLHFPTGLPEAERIIEGARIAGS